MGKWIDHVDPVEPVSRLATRALSLRLHDVWLHLRLAAEEAQWDQNHVHRLRVATRRASAALRLFKPLTPHKRRRQMRDWLRQARQAAGDARDLDVLSGSVRKLTIDPAAAQIVLAEIEAQRCQAQPPMQAVYAHLRAKNFERKVDKLVARTRWRSTGKCEAEPTVAQSARQRLPSFIDELVVAARADFKSLDSLHAFRIAGKRLRYALEIFGAAIEPDVRKVAYRRLVELQDRLGAVNDSHTAAMRIEQWPNSGPGAQQSAFLAAHAAFITDRDRDQRLFVESFDPQTALDWIAPLVAALACPAENTASIPRADEVA